MTTKTPANQMKKQLKLHNQLLWWSAACMVIWMISGICHPLMSWLGPKQVAFKPPVFESHSLASHSLEMIPNILTHVESSGILEEKELRVVKVVPTNDEPLLQLTITDRGEMDNRPESNPVREYFSLQTGELVPKHDELQARWLASYYTGKPESDIVNIQLKKEFDNAYPWVNRLLPVYLVTFKGEEQLTAFVHTETMALASLTNETKSLIQTVFQILHTFNFLDDQKNLRVAGVFMAMLCLIGMSVSGFMLVLLIRSRKIKQVGRRWHRRLAYIVIVPLFAWSITGAYHLIQMAYVESASGMRLAKPLDLEAITRNQFVDGEGFDYVGFEDSLVGVSINAVSLVQLDSKPLMYRVSASKQAHSTAEHMDHKQKLVQKYQGQSSEKVALYFDAATRLKLGGNNEDKYRAVELALQFSGSTQDQVTSVSRVTRFGPDYDFRNKRLPVWKVALNNDEQSVLFIDPTTGILVDQTHWLDRPERWAFSIFHKWNFLTPFIGRFNRDVLVGVVGCLSLVLTGLGLYIRLKRRTKIKKAKASSPNTEQLGELG